MAVTKIQKTPGGMETILVVEDEEAQLALLKTVFEKQGYKVLTARDGPEALDLYSRHKNEVAVVFCDVALPKLGGLSVLYRIKEKNPRAKVVLTSGFLDENVKAGLLGAGAKDFIQKPYLPNDVLKKIRAAIDEDAVAPATKI